MSVTTHIRGSTTPQPDGPEERTMITAVSRPQTANQIDDFTDTVDVTDTVVVAVDAEPETLGEALDRLPLGESATRALDALGVADRIALGPALLASSPGTEHVFGLVWRVEGPAEMIDPGDLQVFDTPGYVKVIWDVRVRPSGGGGSFLSTTTRFAATDEVTRARLFAGWGVIGPFTKSLSQRTLAAVKAYAEDWDELAA
jgi:hypothetical protein